LQQFVDITANISVGWLLLHPSLAQFGCARVKRIAVWTWSTVIRHTSIRSEVKAK